MTVAGNWIRQPIRMHAWFFPIGATMVLTVRQHNGSCAPKRPAPPQACRQSRKTKNRAWLFEVRELWAKLANAALEKGGHEARIDHRSLEAQGITERLPQLHRGVAGHMEKRGIKTERGERYRQRQESNARLAVLHAELAQVNQEIKTLLAR